MNNPGLIQPSGYTVEGHETKQCQLRNLLSNNTSTSNQTTSNKIRRMRQTNELQFTENFVILVIAVFIRKLEYPVH
jgi:hypothetical protein